MPSIRKKTLGNEQYHYLEHSYRDGGKVHKKELYLGKTVPDNIEDLKKQLISEVYQERWFGRFDRIKEQFRKEQEGMPPSALEKSLETFVIRFTYDTNRIEGSTLTYRETADLLEKGITPGTRPLSDVKEAESHRNTFYEMLEYTKDLSLNTVLYFHKKLFESTKSDIAGIIRSHQVAISGSKFMPPFPAEIYPLLIDFFKWYQKHKNTVHAVELAALVHLKLVTIHPFTDGNGRISRLMMNFILHKHDYPMLDIPYERRAGYYKALEKTQTTKDDNPFLQWFFKRYEKENNKYLK